MKHPNATVLEKLYADFSKGKFDEVLAACADNVTFQIAGRSRLAGKFTKADFVEKYASKINELGTFEVHDIMASDRHGIALTSSAFLRAGDKAQTRTVHVWRFENGQPVAFYEYPRDMYQFDSLWS
jgi:ketosteroid isomerase-like protein